MRASARRAWFAALLLVVVVVPVRPAVGQSYVTITGEGSSWAYNAIDAMRVNVKQFGITVNYSGTGSTAGRKAFLNGVVHFAASDIPFQFKPEDGSEPDRPKPGSYAYMPITAGGTAFMYNLKINGQRVTNLRLSGENVAKLFTGAITSWDDPAIKADNPGLTMPARKVVPVVRSDGSGSTAQFTGWMINQHPGIWTDYCERSKRAPACGVTSFYPTIDGGMISQSGDNNVAGYLQQGYAEGAIGYVNYSYAKEAGFPVAKVLNRGGFYTEPTPENVSVSLLKAKINRDESSPNYLTQQLDEVYADTDPRNYQLSSYSYLILPTTLGANIDESRGRTLGAFSYYAMCQAQEQSASLGYSPMPINLVEASLEQVRKIPGVEVQTIDIAKCNNPTFSPDGTNLLAKNAKPPQECDRKGPSQCATGTGGAKASTPVKAATGAAQAGAGAGSGQPGSSTAAAAGAAGSSAAGRSTSSGATSRSAARTATGAPAGPDTAGAPACQPGAPDCPTEDLAFDLGEDAGGDEDGENRSEGELGVAVTTLISTSSGWSAVQTLMVVSLLLVVALVLAPALVWRHLSTRRVRR